MFKINSIASILCMTLFMATTITTANFKEKEKSALKRPEPALDNSDVRWEGFFFWIVTQSFEAC